MKKLKPLITILIGFLIIFLTITNIENEKTLSSLSPSINLSNAINNDLEELKKNGQLPDSVFNSISSIKLNTGSLADQKIKPTIKIKTKSDGKYALELTFLNENPNEKTGRYLIQFSVYDRSTKNLEWEKFRIYNR